MTKPVRSPLLGYNHNVKYRGRIFHVQTEDSGPANPHLFTHLYYEGTILASKRHEYDGSSAEDVVRLLMQGQHKSILKDLKQAAYDRRLEQFFAARGESLEPPFDAEMATPRALDLDALTAPALDRPAAPPVPVGDTLHTDEIVLPPPPRRPVAPAAHDHTEEPTEKRPAIAVPATPPPERQPATPPVVVLQPPPKRRPTSPVIPTAVVVQRTVVVGGDAAAARAPGPTVSLPPRTRRPAQPIPYVVKEGSHPTIGAPHTPPPVRDPGHVTPPARPVNPPPLPPPLPPRTAAPPPRPPEPVADKSLDEVILAYLAQGGTPDK